MPRKDNLVVGNNYALAKNIQKVTTKGIEFEFAYKTKLSSHENLLINSGITFLKSISTEPTPSFYIISHAKILLQSNLIYSSKKISLATNFIYKKRGALSASAIDASISSNYFLWNTKVNYKIVKKVEIFISVNNITNISYSDLLGSRMPGRWSTAGVNFNF
jgi:iron complex outermembrane receptor protein